MSSLKDYELVVIGGGPAGSSTACSAASKGIRVALLEQEESIAMRVKTSGVTWQKDAEALGIPKDLYKKISIFRFYSPKGYSEIRCSGENACVLDVRGFYQYLAEDAADKGADIYLGCRAIKAIKEGAEHNPRISKVIASERGGSISEFSSELFVDASGFNSFLLREIDNQFSWKIFGVGAEYEAYVENLDEDSWILMLGKEFSPAGYAWVFPLGKKKARIGVGIGRPNSEINPADHLDSLLSKRPGPLSKLGRIQPIEFHYGMVPNQGLNDRLAISNFAMVGDAAGQINPLVLEGIRFAVRYGRLCGETAADYLNSEIEDGLKSYEDRVKKEIKAKIAAAKAVQTRWLNLDDEGWDKEVRIINELSCEEFISFIKADFNPSIVTSLALRHPSLLARELFGTVKYFLGI